MESISFCLKLVSCHHRSNFWLERIHLLKLFRRLLFLPICVFLHRRWHFGLGVGNLSILSNPLTSLQFILSHLFGEDQDRACSWDRISFERSSSHFRWNQISWVLLHLLLRLFFFPETKWFLIFLSHCHRLTSHCISPCLIGFTNTLITWDQNLRWNGLTSELILDKIIFLQLLAFNHLLYSSFSNALALHPVSQIETKRFRYCHTILTFPQSLG